MHARRGFTLVEMLVTLAVIGILAAIAVPQTGRWVQNARLKSGVIEMLVTIQHARMTAVKENRNVIVTFDPDGDGLLAGAYRAFVDNGGGTAGLWTRDADERIVKAGCTPAGVDIFKASFAGGVPRFRFDPMGFPNGLGGHVYLKNKLDLYMGIHLNLNGTTRIVRSPTGEPGTWN